MPKVCAVSGCNKTSRTKGLSFYGIPSVKLNEGNSILELTKTRQELWLKAINREDVTLGNIKPHHQVCCDHFISGRPAYYRMDTDPDWIPTKNLSGPDLMENKTTAMDRHLRQLNFFENKSLGDEGNPEWNRQKREEESGAHFSVVDRIKTETPEMAADRVSIVARQDVVDAERSKSNAVRSESSSSSSTESCFDSGEDEEATAVMTGKKICKKETYKDAQQTEISTRRDSSKRSSKAKYARGITSSGSLNKESSFMDSEDMNGEASLDDSMPVFFAKPESNHGLTAESSDIEQEMDAGNEVDSTEDMKIIGRVEYVKDASTSTADDNNSFSQRNASGTGRRKRSTNVTKMSDSKIKFQMVGDFPSHLTSNSKKLGKRPKTFMCDLCEQTFINQYQLTCHWGSSHKGEKPHRCMICDKRFNHRSDLRRHHRIHTGETPFECSTCGKAFADHSNLLRHFTVHTGVKPYVCLTCGKSFSLQTILNSHLKIHTGEKPFQCSTCGKAFARSTDLRRHLPTHTGEKCFECSVCRRAFAHNEYLMNHIREHTGEKPYKCPVCGKAYARNSTLYKHTRTHFGEKRFSCSMCDKKFYQNSDVQRHFRTHTGEKPFECSVCGKCFTQRSSLQLHFKTHGGKGYEKPARVSDEGPAPSQSTDNTTIILGDSRQGIQL